MSEVSKDSCQSLAIVGARASLHSRKITAGNLSGPGAPSGEPPCFLDSTKDVVNREGDVGEFFCMPFFVRDVILIGVDVFRVTEGFLVLLLEDVAHNSGIALKVVGERSNRRLELSRFLSIRIERLGIDLHLSIASAAISCRNRSCLRSSFIRISMLARSLLRLSSLVLFRGVLTPCFIVLILALRQRFLRRSSLLGLGMEDCEDTWMFLLCEGACLEHMNATLSSNNVQAVSWSLLGSVIEAQSTFSSSVLIATQSAELKLMSSRRQEGVKTGRSGVCEGRRSSGLRRVQLTMS